MTIQSIMLAGIAATAFAAEPPASIRLRDVAAEAGVHFRFFDGSRHQHDLPEIMGGGVALFDFDGDGHLDLYLTNGGPIDPKPADPTDPPCRLFRNRGNGRFEDITATAGVPGPSYAMGAAVADYDGDGRDDLFVAGWRDQRLYRNRGSGRFQDVTEAAGLVSKSWSTAAAWADLDADGDLDLVVVNYVEHDPAQAPKCYSSAAPGRDYCGPEDFPAEPDRLYRNNGDGTFTDVSRNAWPARPEGPGLGVIVADLVGDPRPDIYIANDGVACRLLENLGGLKFRETAVSAGVAYDGQGDALAGMGVASGDLDGDGRVDLVVGNLAGRSTVAYRNRAAGAYADESATLGLTAATRNVTGFGLALVDLDADGRLDLAQANGHVLERASQGHPLAMRSTLLRNTGRSFRAEGIQAPSWLDHPARGRGLAVGDFDGDGRPDLVAARLDAPTALLRNEAHGRYLTVEPKAASPKARIPFGARLRLVASERTFVRDLPGGGSYLSSSEPRVHFGLTASARVERLEITWPSGRAETWRDLPASGLVRVTEGAGMP